MNKIKGISKEDYLKQSEKQIHEKLVEWFYSQPTFKDHILMGIPNELPKGLTPLQRIIFSKAMNKKGKVAGFPDLVIFKNGGQVACVELKRDKKAKVDLRQITITDKLNKMGFKSIIATSYQEAEDFIVNFLKS